MVIQARAEPELIKYIDEILRIPYIWERHFIKTSIIYYINFQIVNNKIIITI